MNISETNRTAVWTKTACIGGGYILTVWLVYIWLSFRGIAPGGLYLPLALLVVQCAAIALLLAGSFSTKRVNQLRQRLTERLNPLLREKLAMYAAGAGSLSSLQRLNRRYPRDVERSIVEFLSSLSGEPHGNVSKLCAELGLVTRWERQYQGGRPGRRRKAIARLALLSGSVGQATLVSALEDKDASVRIDAAKALLQSGGMEEIERVFHLATGPSLLMRVILAEALRPHALLLSERAIPSGLRSKDTQTVLITLQFLEAWQDSMPLPDLNSLVTHGDHEIRAKAVRMLPYNSSSEPLDAEILTAMKDSAEGVRSAAAFAAAKLGVESALPALAAALRDSSTSVVKASASALAEMGPLGMQALEDEVFYGTCPASAMEALERVGLDR